MQMTADVNIRICNGRVFDTVAVGHTASKLTRIKRPNQEVTVHAHCDDRDGRGIAIATHPVGITTADGPGQAIDRAIEVESAGLAVIACENAQRGLLLYGQGISDLCHSFNQVWPADLGIEVSAI